MADDSFFSRVYALVARIPKGRVMTYGQIAAALNNSCSARYVGFAVSSAGPGHDLPFHRVVNRLGEMAPGLVFGGQELQRRLLASEGVPFLPDGRINLALARFVPDETQPDAALEQL